MSALLLLDQNGENKQFPCQVILTLGRDKNNDVVLADLKVSRNHAMVRCLGNEDFYLTDGGSSNGTYVNAKRISMPTLLQNGDKITIGSSDFSFVQEKLTAEELPQDDGGATVLIQRKVEVSQFVILVADIRGFTTLSESIPIERLTQIMNTWFHAATDCVQQNFGIVDKFLGDCVYARWETGNDMVDAVINAARSASMLNALSEKINKKYADVLTGPREMRIGVGINAGNAAVGLDKSDTAIGDAVNLAFRLESSSKDLGKDVILGKDAYQHLPEAIWSGKEDSINVKGKADAVSVCGLTFTELAEHLQSLQAPQSL